MCPCAGRLPLNLEPSGEGDILTMGTVLPLPQWEQNIGSPPDLVFTFGDDIYECTQQMVLHVDSWCLFGVCE